MSQALPLLSAHLEEGPALWRHLREILLGAHAGNDAAGDACAGDSGAADSGVSRDRRAGDPRCLPPLHGG